jgi:ABC-type sulfate transport system permease subunit
VWKLSLCAFALLLFVHVSSVYAEDGSSGIVTISTTAEDVDAVLALALFAIILAITLPVAFFALQSKKDT